MGLPPPDPHSLCPLSTTEFVEPPLNKIPGYATDAMPSAVNDNCSTELFGRHKMHVAVKRDCAE